VLDGIGNTPLVRLNRLPGPQSAEVVVKREAHNPGGSVKDRPALEMIRTAERDGRLAPGRRLVEPTSGNTGIGIALVAAVRGYPCTIVMPASASRERVLLLQAYGAEVVLSPAEDGMPGAIAEAEAIVAASGGEAVMLQQFENPANPAAHLSGTGPEILRDLDGRLDAFVATAGTGGTITGTGRYLRAHLPDVTLVVVEPAASPVLSGGKPGHHRIPGMGPGFVPRILDLSIIDRIVSVTDEDAIATARRLMREEGLSSGPSSGASVFAALAVARELGPGRRVVAILPDTGERYLSTELFDA
jgi:cysteine synthase A